MENGYLQRPTMLHFEHHIKHYPQCHEAYNFVREASTVWNTLISCKLGRIREDLIQDLFHQINLNPSKEQIDDMLRNAKLCSSKSRLCNGLSFGEFSVLAADFRKFSSRTNPNCHQPFQITSLSPRSTLRYKKNVEQQINDEKKLLRNDEKSESSEILEAPEVFLGGSCNPTTWRADVAMPELQKLGISFYNPQVSQWTPDLIELEHRAKEKARVLFFVMDSETRASAGAIEAANIAGQNVKPLILVLHPYKRNQKIFNEAISEEEFLDLSRNQKLLKQLVTRRGLPVLDNILTGLQKIKGIVAGEGPCDIPPHSIGSRLISVHKSYDRENNNQNGLTLAQCQSALKRLGFRRDLVAMDNLKRTLSMVREVLMYETSSPPRESSIVDQPSINFEEFCVISSYLTVLQQEIQESCISPIKGTNLPPPPIFLTNSPGIINQYNKQCSQTDTESTIIGICNQQRQQSSAFNRSYAIDASSSTSSMASNDERHSLMMSSNGPKSDSSRDSGTSSPLPNEIVGKLLNGNSGSSIHSKSSLSGTPEIIKTIDYDSDSNDSNDSVFSTGSSLDDEQNYKDIYLGGSCALRTKWRQEIAVPMLNKNNVTFHLPTLDENLSMKKVHKDGKTFIQEVSEIQDESGLMFRPRVLDSSRVLLFVITNETRSLAPMTLAAHYIGMSYNVVLCIQTLKENCKIGNDLLTPAAVKDYNRGRMYLKDLAEKQGITVFDSVEKAVAKAIEEVEKIKLSKLR